MENNKINKRTIFDINGYRISDGWDDISLEGVSERRIGVLLSAL